MSAFTLLEAASAVGQDTGPKRVVPYAYLREADAMWCRRVWREIDLREKVNLRLYYPLEPANGLQSLFDVIKQALLTDVSITAYDVGATGQDDEFRKPLTTAEVRALLQHTDTVFTEDLDTGEQVAVLQDVSVNSADIKRYRLKEDWVFDRQRSVMDIRIIGLAPMKEVRGADGEVRGYA
ncbi:MAG TPA: gliding motility protein GldN, partial [Flavobacteriales bacterium]|nr:gliding motility protein GldN [Flavobacteriales bacterium]